MKLPPSERGFLFYPFLSVSDVIAFINFPVLSQNRKYLSSSVAVFFITTGSDT
jgi:hypothetical protein